MGKNLFVDLGVERRITAGEGISCMLGKALLNWMVGKIPRLCGDQMRKVKEQDTRKVFKYSDHY